MGLLDYSATELSAKIKNKEIGVREATQAVLNQIEEKDREYNCYITVDSENALKNADEIQKLIDDGSLNSPLAGVPVAIKDNICVKNMSTTCGSKILKNFIPTYNAQAAENLIKAGANHVAGGSSGGSAAAVAAKECYFALGSDTGGSIRQPAGYCGVVGLKPSYQTVSRYGLVAYASSLEQIGPIAKDVTDCANILDVIASYDPKDSTSLKREYGFADALINDVKGMKIGIPREYLVNGIDSHVKKSILKAADLLKEKGAIVEECSLKLSEYAIPAYYTIASAEASSNLERFDGIKYGYRADNFDGLHDMYKKTRSDGFGTEVKRRITLGSFVLSSGFYDAYYLKAMKVRALIKREFDKCFEKFDLILGPVAPTTAPILGESLENPMKMYLSDIYTVSANLAGLCGISVPCGKDSAGLPVGLQMIGDCYKEKNILRAAYTYEQAVKERQGV